MLGGALGSMSPYVGMTPGRSPGMTPSRMSPSSASILFVWLADSASCSAGCWRSACWLCGCLSQQQQLDLTPWVPVCAAFMSPGGMSPLLGGVQFSPGPNVLAPGQRSPGFAPFSPGFNPQSPGVCGGVASDSPHTRTHARLVCSLILLLFAGFSPTSPGWSPTSPGFSPQSPAYSPTSPGKRPVLVSCCVVRHAAAAHKARTARVALSTLMMQSAHSQPAARLACLLACLLAGGWVLTGCPVCRLQSDLTRCAICISSLRGVNSTQRLRCQSSIVQGAQLSDMFVVDLVLSAKAQRGGGTHTAQARARHRLPLQGLNLRCLSREGCQQGVPAAYRRIQPMHGTGSPCSAVLP